MIDHAVPGLVATAFLLTALAAARLACQRVQADRLIFVWMAFVCGVWSAFYWWVAVIGTAGQPGATLARSFQAFTISVFVIAIAYRGRAR